ncbi:D-alanyl-D-alanine carboxypeptidase [Bradyrhizobium sp.]|uniref:D-alanyl-D-alanine carboxypeptidase n=1 Tax=Bradyrhizobium sp. TaxID=376 RepID=UPI002733E329|nr:D-alanyl-D-alanine carboxypeptidase [Bradyrhizobium sp.]MDP3691421.1 D-alanyl-D-alanine carboxypeptidase [Bradyrhizobium sp.]
MLRTTLASSRNLRVCVLGLATIVTAVIFTTDSADARRYRKHVRHHAQAPSYSPAFASIIVDANSGATLTANNPDAIRYPASLTKIMTLYLLFERLESGKLKLDSEMEVSEFASRQAPTKLGLRPGQTISVEDAIKGLVTRSANDASVVIAEAISGDVDDFAKLMTRKARALGMTKTVYRNPNGLPNSEQVTTARDQATLGRAIQERFPRYYRYFATSSFVYRGHAIRSHNRLLGNVEGVDGIKTGYTRASGFNLVTSMRRGNRHLVGVVLGGRSGGSRDAIMRNLLAENLAKGATHRTVAAITERSIPEANAAVAEAEAAARPTQTVQAQGAIQVAAAAPAAPTTRSIAPASKPMVLTPAVPPQARTEPAPLTSGVIQTQQIAAIPGSSEPMKPVRVKTVQVKAGPIKLASAGPDQPATITHAITPPRHVPETSGAVVAKAEINKAEINTAESNLAKTQAARTQVARTEMPQQPVNHGTGNGILGVLPASNTPPAHPSQAMAYVAPAPRAQPQTIQQNGAIKPAVVHTGWIIQVGALESESEALARIETARGQARGLLAKAEPFTEPVIAKGDRKLYRARFAGLDRDQAEAVCKTLKRSDISCITVRN